MTDELIEAVARAINPYAWELPQYPAQESARKDARAALQAIEASRTHVVVPTKLTRVMEAVCDVAVETDRCAEDLWSAMLAARPRLTP